MKNNNKKAFTLVELITAITIFSLFIAVISSSYIFLIGTLREAQSTKDFNAEVMDSVDRMAEEIRISAIDYNCYSGNSHPVCSSAESSSSNGDSDGILDSSYLVLLNIDQTKRTIFRIKDSKLQILKQTLVENSWNADDGFENLDKEPYGFMDLTSAGVLVNEGKFHITPNQDPYASSFNELQYQPQVTLDFEFQNNLFKKRPIILPIHTTSVSRVYGQNL